MLAARRKKLRRRVAESATPKSRKCWEIHLVRRPSQDATSLLLVCSALTEFIHPYSPGLEFRMIERVLLHKPCDMIGGLNDLGNDLKG
jgi:hypothetical protein